MPKFICSQRSDLSTLRTLDTRPDDTDARDYIFEPSLAPLPDAIDHRNYAPVLDQLSEGACVGFALATIIHIGNGRRVERLKGKKPAKVEQVSPRMLYEMARRYDDWRGEDYEGTSLRGAMKGWHKHGVTTEKMWPYMKNGRLILDRELTPERALDAAKRPVGAYQRIIDSDVSHLQAAILEGDAVFASAYIHPGWQQEHQEKRKGGINRIPPRFAKRGLHAFAIVGYTSDGFIIQNSWGKGWGTKGYALLTYEDWFENRQDAWVARQAPGIHDGAGNPKIMVVGFAGQPTFERAGTAAVGLEIDPQALSHLINTGDRGELSSGGSLGTRRRELSSMAQQVLTTPEIKGVRHVILYAHGGLVSESLAAQTASRIWCSARERQLGAYLFVWESGVTESIWGWLKSDDDATGPTGFSFEDAWEKIKQGTGKIVRSAQKQFGEALAPVVRKVFWDEMKGRAQGASARKGGAALFVDELFRAMAQTPTLKYKLHIVAHSAGSIYLGWLYQMKLKALLLEQQPQNVTLPSIQFMAPAITLPRATEAFRDEGGWAVAQQAFLVHTLKPEDEDTDNIQIYPSSLLTYVADCLEDPKTRIPVLGIRQDFENANVNFAFPMRARISVKHDEFDDAHHEIEDVLDNIAEGRF